MTRCDVILTSKDEVYINGTLIGRMTDFNVVKSGTLPTLLTIELHPTSVIYGDVPKDTVDDLNHELTDGDEDVNIDRAIARAKARRAGLDPLKAVPAPTADRARKKPYKAALPEAAYPEDEDKRRD